VKQSEEEEEKSAVDFCSIALFAAAASEILFCTFVFAAHFLFFLFFGVLFRCGERGRWFALLLWGRIGEDSGIEQ
jgi:hypothetical protein